MSKRLATIVAIALLIATIVVIMGAWICAALGYNVQNALSAEGLRWFFMHSMDDERHLVTTAILLLLMIGCLQEGRVFGILSSTRTKPNRRASTFTLLLLSLLLFLFLLGILHPSSPLLSVTGKVWPSPFIHGLVPTLCFCIIILTIVHARLSGRINSIFGVFDFLACSLGRHLLWLFSCIMVIFLYNLLCFIL